MCQEFYDIVNSLDRDLKTLTNSEPVDVYTLPTKPLMAGIYVLFEGAVPIYVGRTRNLRQRMKSHIDLTNPNRASFVFLMACETFGRKKASYTKKGSRKELHADPIFKEHFINANTRLKNMTVKFIEITDPNRQHIFELYAAMSLKTPYNKFDTH